jgi:hypothetical protein
VTESVVTDNDCRQAWWSESIAVGSDLFVENIKKELQTWLRHLSPSLHVQMANQGDGTQPEALSANRQNLASLIKKDTMIIVTAATSIRLPYF